MVHGEYSYDGIGSMHGDVPLTNYDAEGHSQMLTISRGFVASHCTGTNFLPVWESLLPCNI